jgi:Ser/Thr protein kinase RdoA (MazF antagonist)
MEIRIAKLGVDNKVSFLSENKEILFVVKEYSKKTSLEVNTISELQNYLAELGLPVSKSWSSLGSRTMVQEYVPGNHVVNTNKYQISEIARLMAKVNKIKIPKKHINTNHQFNFEKHFKLCEKLFCVEELKNIYKSVSQVYKIKLKSSFVHGDISPTNILFEKNQIVGLLDWDHSSFGTRITDIARSQIFYSFDLDKRIFKHDTYLSFIDSYESISHLSALEKRSIFSEMKLVLIRMILETYYYVEVEKEVSRSRLKNKFQDLTISSLCEKMMIISSM